MIDNKIRFCRFGGGVWREDELGVVARPVFFYLNKQFSKVRVIYYLLLLKKNNYLFCFFFLTKPRSEDLPFPP